MRPRLGAVENRRPQVIVHVRRPASMRPRLGAVENLDGRPTRTANRPSRFNAAVAGRGGEPAVRSLRRRGRHRLQCGHGWAPWRTERDRHESGRRPVASMRPRLGAVENLVMLKMLDALLILLQCGHGWAPW